MTNTELLLPRYMANFHDPYCTFGTGDIFIYEPSEDRTEKEFCDMFESENYKKGFIKLEWWELREIEDMPEYVVSLSWKRGNSNSVYKVKRHLTTGCVIHEWEKDSVKSYSLFQLQPATKEDYENHRPIIK